MSTQRFEYNGFPVSEGTVAAFPCGTVTAGAELLRALAFSTGLRWPRTSAAPAHGLAVCE